MVDIIIIYNSLCQCFVIINYIYIIIIIMLVELYSITVIPEINAVFY